ncbi:GAF domain-containing protein [Oceanimonas baumannii]|uniref:Free methionine-(R)-sulfoxide reductase n=1 Tax=Oceanimonas baumannii TaxID=129578 RepID=A0A235C9Z4_9GAMM|nr:GAF domain-containing protein [Oceanimonas baumannii]OYD21219.1 Free methionine-(R)-sulfoxide reductase [Oceanimonas baumannii]TDW55280.1 GAF domain-containing protein [Oceanimonas baumannii]
MSEKHTLYQSLISQALALCEGEPDRIAKLANLSALLNLALEDINWVGFYLDDGRELVLGPFQGKPACVRIPRGKGVCGTAAATGLVQRVADVHAFAGHIACDAASNSEIVLPLTDDSGHVWGVLDIDSPILNRFDAEDEAGLAGLVQAVLPLL